MSEKRFAYDKPLVAFSKGGINDNVTGETYEFTMGTVLDLLNEQQDTIQSLKEELKLEQDFSSRWQKESEMLAEENEQLRKENKRKENEIKLIRKQYSKIPKNIREIWKD